MQVSAINFNNSFKGFDDDDEIDIPKGRHHRTFEETADRVDFDKLANGIKETGKTDKKSTPLKFGIVTLLLGAGSFVATNKVSQKTLKAITSKLDLDGPLDRSAKSLMQKLENMKKLNPVDVVSVKTFFINLYRRTGRWFAHATENLGKSGLTEAEKTGQNAGALCVRNAMRKAASIALAAGVAGGVVTEQYKDKDGNNIPDKFEEVCNGAKTATSLLGIINDAILD